MYSVMENLRKLFPPMRANVLQNGHKNVSMVWKTQNPGHVTCDSFKEPQTHYTLAKPEMDNYCWNLHPTFDELSRNYSTIMNYEVIDMSPLYFRADAHPGFDCLHYCVPGPLDLFSILFLNKLLYGEI